MAKDADAFFWQIIDGRMPPPACAGTLGIEFLTIDPDAGTIEVRFEGKPEFCNPAGNIQGGFLAAMLDDTMGTALAAMLKAGELAPTLNLNVQFHRPARPGLLTGHGRVTLKGGTVCHLAGELFQDSKLVASATATAAIRSL
jgi:uncharacterized protein (TIGR00369 family)